MPFTDAKVKALKPQAERQWVPEPGRTGLWVMVGKTGQRVWWYRYRFHGVQKKLRLGVYPDMGLAEAHSALAAAKAKLAKSTDPGIEAAVQAKAEREAGTIEEFVAEYIQHHAREKMKPAGVEREKAMLEREVVPIWKGRKTKDIKRRDIILLLDDIRARGAPVTRNRVASLLSRFFKCAVGRDVVEASPAVGIEQLTEKPESARFLSQAEIRSFWNGLDAASMRPSVRIALKFLLVTGQRRAEVSLTARSEIEGDLWTLPAERVKSKLGKGRTNYIPLPPLALRLIAEADAARLPSARGKKRGDAISPWLFPSSLRGHALDPSALTHALNDHRELLGIGDATVHDLRRTFATWNGEIGMKDQVPALLNHAPIGITEQRYDHSTNLPQRRKAMEVWCSWLEGVVTGEPVAENVVPMRKAGVAAHAMRDN